jgi:hypothetical protein
LFFSLSLTIGNSSGTTCNLILITLYHIKFFNLAFSLETGRTLLAKPPALSLLMLPPPPFTGASRLVLCPSAALKNSLSFHFDVSLRISNHSSRKIIRILPAPKINNEHFVTFSSFVKDLKFVDMVFHTKNFSRNL